MIRRAAPRALAIVLGAACAVSVATVRWDALGAPKSAPKTNVVPDAAGPATQLKATPRLSRVRFEIAPGAAIVVHDLVFPKGALSVAGPASAGPASIFLAFTAQARPMAVEVTEHTIDASGALVESGAKTLDVLDVYLKPPSAAVVLGPPKGAGHVVKVPRTDAAFALRVRSAIATTAGATPQSLTLMARLGVRDGAPIDLDRIEVVGTNGLVVAGARATLCGPGADPTPLMIEFPGFPPSPTNAGAVPAASVTRKSTDDLCVDVAL